MSRYTCSVIAKLNLDQVSPALQALTTPCHLEILHTMPDYIMGREIPGKVPFSKLVTIEALVDRTNAQPNHVKINFVFKNEELPLNIQNHCKQIFDRFLEVLKADSHWELISANND